MRENEGGSMVQLSGRLSRESVGEAKHACTTADPPLLIDATELREADSAGLALLVELLDQGARVEGLTNYLAMRVATMRERRRA